MSFEVVRQTSITEDAETKTYLLAPIDIFCLSSDTYLSWPMFFNYDIDGDKIVEALKNVAAKYPVVAGRIVKDPDTRYGIEVDPSKEGAHGFPFTEVKTDISIAEAVLEHSQLKVASADFPCFPEMPFFMESLDVPASLEGKEPLMKVKLTHFSDGSTVNITIQHLVVDGQRCLEILRDIGLAYRGQEVPDRDHDRSRMWPDQLVKHYPFLGEDVGKLPRKATPEKEQVPFMKFPGVPCQTETLYFSRATLDEMKAVVTPFLLEGEFVSTNDVLVAFFWMLICETISQKHPVTNGTDLALNNTMANCGIEFRKNGIDVVPENYCGNAILTQFLPNQGIDFEGKTLPECFALLAGLVRKTLGGVHSQPEMAAQGIMAFYQMVSTGTMPVPVDTFRAALTNLVKTPVGDVDFGKGAPVLAHITLPMPLIGPLMAAGPAPGDDEGVLVYGQFLAVQLAVMKTSTVVKECAPGMKYLYSDFTVDELNALLKTK